MYKFLNNGIYEVINEKDEVIANFKSIEDADDFIDNFIE